MNQRDYDDGYATCGETFATLRIYPGGHAPASVTEVLGVSPTRVQSPKANRDEAPSGPRINAWFLSSKGQVASRDVRRHVDWLLDQLAERRNSLDRLRARGDRIDVFCYWRSAFGSGGPMLSPYQCMRLAQLGLTIGFDVYFPSTGASDKD